MDDLSQLALELLETEKRYLLEDKDDYYAAVVVVLTPDGRYFEEVDSFDDEQEKLTAYTGVVARAREQNATAIITLNSSRQMKIAEQDDLEGYWWGQLEAGSASRAVVITISGPGMKAWCMSVPFDIRDSEVVFGQATNFETAKIGLLPNWP